MATHLTSGLCGDAVTVALDQLGRDPGEQIGRQSKLTQALQLRDLAQHAVEAESARIRLQAQECHGCCTMQLVIGTTCAVAVVLSSEQRVDCRHGFRRQSFHHAREELILLGVDRQPDQTCHAVGCGRLDLQAPQTTIGSRHNRFSLRFACDHMLAEPCHQIIGTLNGGLAKAQCLTNLCVVVLDERPDQSY